MASTLPNDDIAACAQFKNNLYKDWEDQYSLLQNQTLFDQGFPNFT